MPREIITIQVGQCGNQIGMAFWELLLQEHAGMLKSKHGGAPVFDAAISSFFKNIDSHGKDLSNIEAQEIQQLKARALVVDTEEGVINQLMKSDIRDLFNAKQFVHDVSGAGNNWAHGYGEYGPQYRNEIINKVRKEAEQASSLQCFLLFHSTGGGTGSGLGTYILSQLADEFPDVYRFTASVFPSATDDVITSPYNCAFATDKLIDFADCVFPVDNDSLIRICEGALGKGANRMKANKIEKEENVVPNDFENSLRNEVTKQKEKEAKKQTFSKMNSIIAHLLSNLTCSMRFEGKLNVDLNEITMNMVPFPRLHFLMASMSPLQMLLNKSEPRSLDQSFAEILLPENQIISCNPIGRRYLAMGILCRGNISFSDVGRNIDRIKNSVNMVWWNTDGFKYGICDSKPIYHVL
jgi:tubulin epsilon